MPTTLARPATVVVACSLALAACGGDSAGNDPLGGPAPQEVVPPSGPAEPNLPSIDAYMLEASPEEVTVQTPEGEQVVFPVKQEDVPALGIEHLNSHGGLTDVGFRVFYEEQDGKRYIKLAMEILPPPLGANG